MFLNKICIIQNNIFSIFLKISFHLNQLFTNSSKYFIFIPLLSSSILIMKQINIFLHLKSSGDEILITFDLESFLKVITITIY